VNREEGFAGTSLRRDEFVCDCSDIDDIIVFRGDGTFIVTKVSAKTFVGLDIIHIDVFKRNDDRTIYNMIYRDGRQGPARIKRFAVTGVTRDKEYSITRGKEGSKILYFTVNPNGEAEGIKVFLVPKPKLKVLSFEYDFSTLEIKGRASQGNILTKKSVKKIVKRDEGVSTLGAIDVWFDDTVKRLNNDGRGIHLGAFKSDDKILTVQKSGNYKLMTYEVTNHFEEDMTLIEKFNPSKIMTVVYFDASQEKPYIKRFGIESDTAINKRFEFIGDHAENKMLSFSFDYRPQLKVIYDNTDVKKPAEDEILNVEEFIGVKSEKAKGKRITSKATRKIQFINPLPYEEPQEEIIDAPGQVEEITEIKKSEMPDKKAPIFEKSPEPSTVEDKHEESAQEKLIRKKKEDDDKKQMELF
jgi:topoisomerase-4 subunit A